MHFTLAYWKEVIAAFQHLSIDGRWLVVTCAAWLLIVGYITGQATKR